jgi:hypothetical protein
MEIVCNQTFNRPAMLTKDMMPHLRLVFVSLEHNMYEVSAKPYLLARKIHIITVSLVSAILAFSYKMDSVLSSILLSLHALLMHFSMVFHAAATQVSINLQSILVEPVRKELPGMAINVVLKLPELARQDIFLTKIQINVSLQHLLVETMHTSMGQAVFV